MLALVALNRYIVGTVLLSKARRRRSTGYWVRPKCITYDVIHIATSLTMAADNLNIAEFRMV